MMRRPAVSLLVALVACGGGGRPATPAPQSAPQALAGFLDAVRANDTKAMAEHWGNDKGAAVSWMKPEDLNRRLIIIQRYLEHTAYRVVEGPTPVAGNPNAFLFRVELRKGDCVHVQPIDVVRVRRGGWIVRDVHLGSAPNPVRPCPGTGG